MSELEARANAAAWFEIPAKDFDRVVTFYESIFAATLRREAFGGGRLAVFAYQPPGVGGAVMEVAPDSALAAGGGTLVYLNCNDRLDEIAGRVVAAGGRLAGPMVELPPGMGRFVHIIDPNDNRVGLHGH